MKQAERLALVTLVVLLLIATGLTVALVDYRTVSFWAGTLAAFAQAILVALAWWGLRLARQQQELAELGGPGGTAAPLVAPDTLRGLSAADDNPAFEPVRGNEVRTLETGFQRVVILLCSLGLLAVAGVLIWLVWSNVTAVKPGQTINISPVALDNGALVAAIGALLGYGVLYSITRVTRQTRGYGAAVHGLVTMGLPGAVAVAGAVVLGHFETAYAGEAGAAAVAAFLCLQALELFINALRNYNGVEEFDQQAVDLQALPLVPMFSSQWLGALQMLLAQSFGVGGRGAGEPGVFARVMPRVIIAAVAVLVAASCLRVVPQGTRAIRERFGYAGDDDINNPLAPGLHVLAPWPIDKLVVIPTEQLQQINVGSDDVVPEVNGQKVDFSLWTTRHAGSADEQEYVTGDHQMLGGFIGVWWRVKNPSDFYRHISHSDFFGNDKDEGEVQGRPIYESLVQENAVYAVIHIFAAHDLEELMSVGRGEAQAHCKQYLQWRLDHLGLDPGGKPIGSGIEIVDLTIKDIHPPQGRFNETQTAGGMAMGPARAYEDVVRAREYREARIDLGLAARLAALNQVQNFNPDPKRRTGPGGEAARRLNEARGDATEQVNKAWGDTAFFSTIGATLDGHLDIAEAYKRNQTMQQVLPQINKIVVGVNVKEPRIIQGGNSGVPGMLVPVGQPAP